MSTKKVDAIKFRMYNTGSVGDCLLLLFQKEGVTTFSMLIDCGGYNTNSQLIGPAVQNIHDELHKNHKGKIDLLIVTHQHEDHISGFNQARDIFKDIEIEEVWMSWVENPSDTIAKVVKEKYGKKLKALKQETHTALAEIKTLVKKAGSVRGAKKRMKLTQQSIEETKTLIDFEEGVTYGKGLKAGAKTNDDAMNYVRLRKKPKYKLPGEVVIDLPGAEGIRFNILGPPRDNDLKFLKIETRPDEMYHMALNAKKNTEEFAERLFDTGVTLVADESPFAQKYHMTASEKKTYLKEYRSGKDKWRQIETDSLASGTEVALALTRLTNNTSLAMALEFEDSGAVILLPADAQSGNWMSWHKPEVSKALKKNGGKSTDELLENTVFYKVGHHGSHNGTASVSGLEKMKSSNLVAFMPLVQAGVPDQWGGAKNFPAKELYNHLIEKTKGRVVRTDEGLIKNSKAVKLRATISASEKKEFDKNLDTKNKLYFEYTIKK